MSKMGAAIFDSGSKVDSSNYFKAVFRRDWVKFKLFFAALRYSWWNMDTMKHTINEKTVSSARRIMITLFRISKDVILIDYLEKGKTVTRQYHADLLDRFNAKLKEK